MLLETLLGYLLECQPQEEHTLSSAVLLLSEMGGGLTGRLLDEYAAIAPDSFAAVHWKLYAIRSRPSEAKSTCSERMQAWVRSAWAATPDAGRLGRLLASLALPQAGGCSRFPE